MAMRKLQLLMAGLFFVCALQAQSVEDTVVVISDTIEEVAQIGTIDQEETDDTPKKLQEPTPRSVEDGWVATQSGNKDFEYLQYIDSALRNRKIEPVINKVQQPKKDVSFNWLKPTLLGLSVVALLFLLLKLWTGRRIYFNPSNTKIKKEHAEEEDPLLVARASTLADEAIRNKEYRLATRYLFADALMRLGENDRLNLQAKKTNSEYLREVQQPDLQADLAKLMLQFEYVWYGGFIPSEAQFQTIYTTFKKFDARWL
ncbi:MAG TPA: DUF4129 domain-containing protein [Phnomibacter sp.]|nr:DUF4129 domain-containing protein [Phnomibacter sp.]